MGSVHPQRRVGETHLAHGPGRRGGHPDGSNWEPNLDHPNHHLIQPAIVFLPDPVQTVQVANRMSRRKLNPVAMPSLRESFVRTGFRTGYALGNYEVCVRYADVRINVALGPSREPEVRRQAGRQARMHGRHSERTIISFVTLLRFSGFAHGTPRPH